MTDILQTDVHNLPAIPLAYATTPAAAHKGFLLRKEFSNQRIVDTLKKMPEMEAHVPQLFQLDIVGTDRVLKVRYRTLEKTIRNAARKILELEGEGSEE
ncbi:hypothetical protein MMC34_001529 [Xylographa carneopallida]|nr:hypothetical protein [Xylographa carneopallida]